MSFLVPLQRQKKATLLYCRVCAKGCNYCSVCSELDGGVAQGHGHGQEGFPVSFSGAF